MKQFFILSVFAIWNFSILFLSADTGTPLDSVMGSLSLSIKIFARTHQGRLPVTWQEVETIGSFDAYKSVTSISDNYFLLASPVFASHMDTDNMYGYGDGQILVIGREPIPDVRHEGLGRYVIYRMKNGEFHSSWFPEAKIQNILSETHITVPPPTVAVSTNNVSPSTSTNLQTQEQAVTSPPMALPEPASSILVASPQTPKHTAEVAPIADNGVPLWIYGIVILGVSLVGVFWYQSRPKN